MNVCEWYLHVIEDGQHLHYSSIVDDCVVLTKYQLSTFEHAIQKKFQLYYLHKTLL